MPLDPLSFQRFLLFVTGTPDYKWTIIIMIIIILVICLWPFQVEIKLKKAEEVQWTKLEGAGQKFAFKLPAAAAAAAGFIFFILHSLLSFSENLGPCREARIFFPRSPPLSGISGLSV